MTGRVENSECLRCCPQRERIGMDQRIKECREGRTSMEYILPFFWQHGEEYRGGNYFYESAGAQT